MSKAKLAELVTQVPDDDEDEPTPTAAAHQPEQAARRFCGLCRYAFPGRPTSQAPKLASVVPTASGPEERKPAPSPPPAQSPQPEQAEERAKVVTPAPPQAGVRHLGPQAANKSGRKTLVLDLDETLVHSSVRTVQNADIVITVELEGELHHVYVRKRPGVDEFLLHVAKLYEVVVYTASMAKYANPLLDELDRSNVICWRLFREACTKYASGYVKDLSRLGRDLKNVIIIDNSPTCYALQPDNAIPIKTWKGDTADCELLALMPILSSLAEVDDIPFVLRQIVWASDEELDDELAQA